MGAPSPQNGGVRADVTRSPKQGYQWLHAEDLCPQKNFKTVVPTYYLAKLSPKLHKNEKKNGLGAGRICGAPLDPPMDSKRTILKF